MTILSHFCETDLEEFKSSHVLPLDESFALVKTEMNNSPFINTLTIYLHFDSIRELSHFIIYYVFFSKTHMTMIQM